MVVVRLHRRRSHSWKLEEHTSMVVVVVVEVEEAVVEHHSTTLAGVHMVEDHKVGVRHSHIRRRRQGHRTKMRWQSREYNTQREEKQFVASLYFFSDEKFVFALKSLLFCCIKRLNYCEICSKIIECLYEI